jgi:exodeoxyribonuclease V alpha subunit
VPLIASGMQLEVEGGTVTVDRVGETECLFLTGLYLAERAIAEQLSRIKAAPLPWPEIDAARALPWIEEKTGLSLAPSQAEAIRWR